MAKISYTPAQRTAVHWQGGNLLLSAAAGSGKTAALTGRIAEIIKNGEAGIDELLVVTFTRAAAAEMRQRITKALTEAVAEYRDDSPETAAMIGRAISKVPTASISTIHSFLYRTLKPYFPVLGLPQDSRIADQQAIDALKAELMRETVDEYFSRDGEELARFTALADIIGQVREADAIDAELLWLANRLVSQGKDHTALAGYGDTLSTIAKEGDIMSSPFGQVLKRSLSELLSHYRMIFDKITEEFEYLPKVKEKYGDVLSDLNNFISGGERLIRENSGYSVLKAHFCSYEKGNLGRLSGKDACETSELFKRYRDEMTTRISSVRNKFFLHSEEEILLSADITSRVLYLASEVLGTFFDKFAKRKRASSLIDYNDLETLALRFLIDENGAPTAAAEEIGSRYKYIFIDEYQDTNTVQDTIFRAISGNTRRFMVGDIKQSIYRFRGAEPDVFKSYRAKWKTVEPYGEDEEITGASFGAEDGASLFMSENFRCSKAVVELVNLVSRYMLPYGDISFEGGDELIYARDRIKPDTVSAKAEVCIIEKKKAPPGEKKDPVDYEAEYVAQRISSMIGKYSPDGSRIVRPEDITILLRAPERNGAVFRDALERRGISTALKLNRPLSSFPSVMLLWCILNFIDNPLRDIYVTGALRSPVFGFSMSELVAVRQKDVPLYLSIVEESGKDSTLSEKCARTVRWLEKQKTVARGMRADKFLEYLIDEIKLYSISGIRDSGSERDAINRLCALASGFAGGSMGDDGLSAFLEHSAAVIDSSKSDDSAESGEGSVSIMSIHASKGLEFPICFVCGCAKARNIKDEQRTVLIDSQLGLGMYLPDEGGLVKCDTFFRQIIAENIRRRAVTEEMRMLYVALTRARDQIIVTAKSFNAEGDLESAEMNSHFSDAYQVLDGNKYLDWILEAAGSRGRDWLDIKVIYSSQLAGGEELTEAEEAEAVTADPEQLEMYLSRFGYTYPQDYLKNIPSKLTVSRLYPEILDEAEQDTSPTLSIDGDNGGEEEAQDTLSLPRFMQGTASSPSGAERGTATHIFMQFVNFRALRDYGVKHEMDRLVRERYITEETARLINTKQMERFAESALLDKLLRAETVERELRFNVLLDGGRFTADPVLAEKLFEGGVKLTVQGVVDCVFRDPDSGKLMLIDYKTDSLTEAQWHDRALAEETLRSRHRDQLTYYREICSQIFSEELEGAYIYSTVLGALIRV